MPAATSDVTVHPLTTDRWDDLAALFQEGGDPKWCWCQFYRERGLDWSNSTAAQNRDRLASLTRDGPPPGLVAYREGRAVGWVSLAPRPAFDRLTHARVLAPVDDKPVWSIVCFVVSRKARGSGVATALLDGAIDWARSQGATILEAYPSDTQGRKIPAANAYHGTLSMFESAGFRVVARRQFNRTTAVRPIVRLEL
ncbi:MAG TPA: GNAT family N-acetyltransferase [Candidatus Limnocylindrales bacterium]|nr:GNAT family N-acetyltransferase [Candidatus Limnocylindrales bacterium]